MRPHLLEVIEASMGMESPEELRRIIRLLCEDLDQQIDLANGMEELVSAGFVRKAANGHQQPRT